MLPAKPGWTGPNSSGKELKICQAPLGLLLCEGQSLPFGTRSDRTTIEEQAGQLHGGPAGGETSEGVLSLVF